MCPTPRSLQVSGPGHRKGKGVGKQTHADNAVPHAYGPGQIMDEINPRDPAFDPAEYIPETGSIVFQDGLTGRGRYDTLNQILGALLDARDVGRTSVTGGCGSPSITTPSTIAGGASKTWDWGQPD